MNNRIVYLILFVLTAHVLYAQQRSYNYLFGKNKTTETDSDLKFYGGLQHQHQDFFNNAFSFQGVEAGIFIKNSFFVGLYGSAFISNLKVEIDDNPAYILINQGGFSGGMVHNNSRMLHTGFLLSAGYFALAGNTDKLPLFRIAEKEISISGLVLSPQVFAELNVSRWMKFRTGLAYNFYNFGSNVMIANSDLENFSFNFGFLFGKFGRR